MPKAFLNCIAACLFVTPCLADEMIGVQTMAADTASSERALSLSVWYPAQAGGTLEDIGRNAVFTGSSAFRDAPVSDKVSPLIIVSHGGLRSADESGAWVSARLAKAGFVVVEVNAPRPRRANDAVDEIWRRPQDVSRTLDTILDDPTWSSVIDRDRISVVGYALGGTAAVALVGGVFESGAFAQTCETVGNGPDCAWFAAQNVSLASVEKAALERSHRDPRISAAVAIDPEYPNSFLSDSLETLDGSLLVIDLAGDDNLWSGTAMANGPGVKISNATSYDGFSICTEQGKAILIDDGGNPDLCGTTAANRDRVHQEIANQISGFLAQ